jgi:hypothetical protein
VYRYVVKCIVCTQHIVDVNYLLLMHDWCTLNIITVDGEETKRLQ